MLLKLARWTYRHLYLPLPLKRRIRFFLKSRLAFVFGRHPPRGYRLWVRQYDTRNEEDLRHIRRHLAALKAPPTISLLAAVPAGHINGLGETIASVRGQLYPHWELHLAGDSETDPGVRKELENLGEVDPRIHPHFTSAPASEPEKLNAVLAQAKGQLVLPLIKPGLLSDHALYLVGAASVERPQAELIYSDEDRLDSKGRRCDPNFKPDWNPDLLRSQPYIGQLAAYRTSVVQELDGLRAEYRGAAAYDLMLRVTDVIPPEHILHLPHVLFHSMPNGDSDRTEQPALRKAGRQALLAHLARRETPVERVQVTSSGDYRVQYGLPSPPPLVSVIIPTKDKVRLLRRCIEGVLEHTDYPNLEIIVVDNQSHGAGTWTYFRQLLADPRVRIIEHDAPFNFSAMNNAGVRVARGSVLALLNNDVRVRDAGWLKEMVSQAMRAEIGVVGAKLYYPNGTIQHAGLVLGILSNAGHLHKHMPGSAQGYCRRLVVAQNLSAVTAACMVLRKEVFQQAGGMDEKLAVAFNDVDLCLRVQRQGYRNLFTPHAELFHLESATRGYDDSPEQLEIFRQESEHMKERWGRALQEDPCYNPNLSVVSENVGLAFPSRAFRPWRGDAMPR